MKRIALLALLSLLATTAFAAVEAEATRRVFGPLAEADRLVVQRGALCHPQWVQARVLATVTGKAQVREVLARLQIEKVEPERVVDPETGEVAYFRNMVAVTCPDYTLFFYRGDTQLGTVGLLGISLARADGENQDHLLVAASREFLGKRFGLVDEPPAEPKPAHKAPEPTPKPALPPTAQEPRRP